MWNRGIINRRKRKEIANNKLNHTHNYSKQKYTKYFNKKTEIIRQAKKARHNYLLTERDVLKNTQIG